MTSLRPAVLLLVLHASSAAAAAEPKVGITLRRASGASVLEFVMSPGDCVGGMPFGFAWRGEAYTVAASCRDGILRDVQVMKYLYMEAGPAIVMLRGEAAAGTISIDGARWSAAFDGPPLTLDVRPVE
jgi:hypothetical protein